MQEDFPHEILPRPAAAKMLSNCKHAHKPRTKSDSKLKAQFPRLVRPSDPSDDHSAIGIGAWRVAGRFVNRFFVPQRFLGFALELAVVFFKMRAGLLLQILGSGFAEAEMLACIFLRLLIVRRITEAIRQIRFLPRGAAIQRIKNLSPKLLLQQNRLRLFLTRVDVLF